MRTELGRDRSLRAAQKQKKLFALTAPMELASTEKTVQEMRSNGAVDEAIYRMRAAAVSVEAADRLAQLDQAEAAWKTPYQRLSRRAQQTSRRQRAGR